MVNNTAKEDVVSETHSYWVQDMESDCENAFQGRVPTFPSSQGRWTPPIGILQCENYIPARRTILMFSKTYRTTQQWMLYLQVQEYASVGPTKYQDLHRCAACVDSFIWVAIQSDKMHIAHVVSIIGLAYLVRENTALDNINSI
jgi:hypothetical protein